MTPVPPRRIQITEPAAKAAQSRVHKQFNTLVKKLDAERARLAAWQAALPEAEGMMQREMEPLERSADIHRKQLMVLFDQAHAHKLMGKRDKAKLSSLIVDLAESLGGGEDDADIRAIHARHGGGDAAEKSPGEIELIKEMLERMTGAPLDDIDGLGTPDAKMEALHAKMEALWQQETREAEAAHAAQERAEPKAASAKANARELRHQAEAQRLQQSLREIYRKLASALHPDRESDPGERVRKTGLMQRVNVAYAANDLLGLLELQLEVEQLDQAGLDGMDEARIKQFNKVLSGQVAELKRENDDMEFALKMDFGLPYTMRVTPQGLMRVLREDIDQMQAAIALMAQDAADFQDIHYLKAWLKTYRIAPARPEYDDWY